jgi:hypothetical protein
MKRKITIVTMLAFLMLLGVGLTGQASALTLPAPESEIAPGVPATHTYGDFYSYSLPVLQEFLGSEYSVKSTPGAIKDGIVIYTGANGQLVTTNDGIMDGAYPTPSGTYTSFSTTTVADPNPTGTGGWDTDLTWDTTLLALDSYLGNDDLYFFFNHNQDNKLDDQSLYAWGRMAIVDTDENSIEATKYYYFNNGGSNYAPVYAPGELTNDYVYAPGQLPLNGTTINHNLGANEAAYAICLIDPEATVKNWMDYGYNAMQIEFRLEALSNGFEQLFILKLEDTTPIPEPARSVIYSSIRRYNPFPRTSNSVSFGYRADWAGLVWEKEDEERFKSLIRL